MALYSYGLHRSEGLVVLLRDKLCGESILLLANQCKLGFARLPQLSLRHKFGNRLVINNMLFIGQSLPRN